MKSLFFKQVSPSVFDSGTSNKFYQPVGVTVGEPVKIGRINSIFAYFIASPELEPYEATTLINDQPKPWNCGFEEGVPVIQYVRQLGGYLYGWLHL